MSRPTVGMMGCNACGATISEEAASCPKCGHPHRKPVATFKWLYLFALVLTGVVAAVIVERSIAVGQAQDALGHSDEYTAVGAAHDLGDVADQRTYAVYAVIALGVLTLVFYLFRRREKRSQAAFAIGRTRDT
jgi:hypothetical protein